MAVELEYGHAYAHRLANIHCCRHAYAEPDTNAQRDGHFEPLKNHEREPISTTRIELRDTHLDGHALEAAGRELVAYSESDTVGRSAFADVYAYGESVCVANSDATADVCGRMPRRLV